jgi:hypothetical protein
MKGQLSEIGYDAKKHDAEIAKVCDRGLTEISDLIEAVVQVYQTLYGQDDYEINCGNCEDFAHDVIDLMGGEVIDREGDGSNALVAVWNDEMDPEHDGSHCFIRYRNRFYDSQIPEGTDDWRNLPALSLTSGE